MLRHARVHRGLTQDGLAELAGLSAQAIGLLERGVRRFPHLTTLDRLTGALDLTASERAEFQRLASRGAVSQPTAPTQPTGPAWVVALQLPAATTAFVGRRRQLDQLAELLTRPSTGPGAPAIATIRGMPGVGKTALAIQAGHVATCHYPDGVLIVNARGFGSGTPLSALQALGQLLRATGVPAEAVPDSLPEASAAFRTRLANRRVLILLDNVRDADQVVEIAADVRDRRREARARLELGELLDELGEHEDAVPNLEFALAFYREHDPVPAQRAAKLLGADSA